MNTQGRVSGGRPDGGQYTSTEHSDAVVALSPADDRLASIATIRSQQLIWQRQQEVLNEQQRQLANKVGEAATASAAIEILEVLPQAAIISYRRDGSEVVFLSALDAQGGTIVTEEDLWDRDKEWAANRPFNAAIRRSEEILETAGLPVGRWVDITVDDAIRKAAAQLQADAAR